MISSTIFRFTIYSIFAILFVYIIFMIGTPIGIEIPEHMLLRKDAKLPKKLLRFYKGQVEERQYWLKKVLFSANSSDGYSWLYNNLVPEVLCPQLVRVGTTNQGGKWICNPWRLPDKCTILSLGLHEETSFEKDLQQMIQQRCRVLGFDKNTPSNLTRIQFLDMNGSAERAEVSKYTNEEKGRYTIGDLLEERDISMVEILKMDEEGGELTTLLPFLEQNTVSQLLVKVYASADQMLGMVVRLSDLGYWLFHNNIDSKGYGACEFSFVHETAFRRYGVKILARYLKIWNRT